MPANFVLRASSEFGINVMHSNSRHLYLFGIGEGANGRRSITLASCRPFQNLASEAEKYQVAARAFAESVAKIRGLIDGATITSFPVETESNSETNIAGSTTT